MALLSEIVSVDDIATYAPNAVNVDASIMTSTIREVQENDLENLIGSQLVYQLATNPSDEVSDNLINGKSYTNDQGDFVNFYGIVKYVTYCVIISLLDKHNIELQAIGFKVPEAAVSENPQYDRIQLYRNSLETMRSDATMSVIKYLNDNIEDYEDYGWQTTDPDSKAELLVKLIAYDD